MNQKRVRMFAGPNGSGKTTLYDYIKNKRIPTYFYINPDQLQSELNRKKFINFADYGLFDIENGSLKKFLNIDNPFYLNFKKLNFPNISIKKNILRIKKKVDSYSASILSEFIRNKYLESNQSFSFETVMSHKSKIEVIKSANKRKYKTYLYFICTDNPDLNIKRINSRVLKKGHDVSNEKVESRYFRSLELLPECLSKCKKSYIFDNSKTKIELIAEFEKGKLIKLHNPNINWFNNLNLK